jgi:toxin-antitoxin system PIN domain toxin
VIAIDSNILVYAHRADLLQHPAARAALRRVAVSGAPWGIPWPALHEFLGKVSSPRVFAPPSPWDLVWREVDLWLASPGAQLLSETPAHLGTLRRLLETSGASGAMVHDARIAAICIEHEVDALWTADRDFQRFPGLTLFNPLTG